MVFDMDKKLFFSVIFIGFILSAPFLYSSCLVRPSVRHVTAQEAMAGLTIGERVSISGRIRVVGFKSLKGEYLPALDQLTGGYIKRIGGWDTPMRFYRIFPPDLPLPVGTLPLDFSEKHGVMVVQNLSPSVKLPHDGRVGTYEGTWDKDGFLLLESWKQE